MINYQVFIKYFLMLKKNFEESGIEDIEIHTKMKTKKALYKHIGLSEVGKIRQYENRKSKIMFDRIELGIGFVEEYGSLYEIDETVRRYIILNDPPKDKAFYKKLSLPFKSIFIETQFNKDDANIGVENIKGLLLIEVPKVIEGDKDMKPIGKSFVAYYVSEDYNLKKNEIQYFIDQFIIDFSDDTSVLFYDDHKTMRFLKKFIINTLLFFNDPEVDFISHKRSSKSRARRVAKGKMPLPDSRTVRLIGRLKKYVDGISHNLSGKTYNYRFWVRGHYRKLTSEKYTAKRGMTIRIEPYKKGEGVMLKRTYELDFEKKDHRKVEMQKENLFYDDIKPLKKPLRQMRK